MNFRSQQKSKAAPKLGCFWQSPFETLENSRGKTHHPHAVVLFSLGVNRNAIRVREGIGNHLKILAIKAYALAGAIAKTFNICAKFGDRSNFGMMAGHDDSIVPLPITGDIMVEIPSYACALLLSKAESASQIGAFCYRFHYLRNYRAMTAYVKDC